MIQYTPRTEIEKQVFTYDYHFTSMTNQSEYDIFHSQEFEECCK